jgi:filamentous hemagglutinin family protein
MNYLHWFAAATITSFLFATTQLSIPASVQAQILAAPDGTNTLVNQMGSTFSITGGTQAGFNLFHSFQHFSVNPGQTANFLSNPAIANILSRVTGGHASLINGSIQVSGSNANLYLMNPAGIVFGANASLNVPGSFTATTANGIGVGNGWFNALGSHHYPALTGQPDPFAFTTMQPGAIINAGNLAVGQGQRLTLLGGIVINAGTVTAPGGTVTIAAVPGEKLVRIHQEGHLLSFDLPAETRSILSSSTMTPASLPALLTGGHLGSATDLTVENGTVRLTGSALPVTGGDVVVKTLTAQTATLSAANNLLLSESQLRTTGDLNLQAANTVMVRDRVTHPVAIQAGRHLTIQGDRGIDILALNHLQQGKPIQAGANLSLISDGVISGDTHYGSGGNFILRSLSGDIASFVSLHDPVISSNGSVLFASNYTGPSLKVEARGDITFTGGITINAADPTAIDANSADQTLLRSGRALILRAGRSVLDNPPNVPILGFNDPTGVATGRVMVGGAIATATLPEAPLTVVITATGNVTTQAITTSQTPGEGGNISISSTNGGISTGAILARQVLDFYGGFPPEGGSVILSAPNGSITTGDLEAGFSVDGAGNRVGVNLTSQGPIQTSNIRALHSVQLNSTAGNVVVETIRTATTNFDGTEITVTTPGLFQARGTFTPNPDLNNLLVRRVDIDAPGNEDIVQFLKSQGVLDANGVIVPAVNQPPGTIHPIVFVDASGRRTVVVDVRRDEIPVSILAGRGDRLPVVRIQHGGRSVDTTQTNDPLGRQFVTITGLGGSDGTQFVVGGVPVRLVTFSITSNFTAPLVDDRGSTPYTGPAIRYQTFAPALFGSDQFPADISGMAGAIATIPTVTNATFPGSLEGIVFRPTTNSNPLNPISSDPVIRGNEASLAGDGSSIVNPVITSVTEQSLQRQPQKPACEGILATTSTTPPETRSPFSVTNPCSSLSDEAQILRILREDGN